jgi:hypothetical protein
MVVRSLLACAFLSLVACKSAPEETSSSAAPAPAAAAPARKVFGAPLGQSPAVALADVIKTPERFAEGRVLVEGAVRQACTRKGCWMELSEAPPGCRVTFKDYGFFVPTDSAGSKARVEAKVETKVIKPELVAHLESEGAKFPDKAADGSAKEVRLVATGVEMWR